NTKEWPFILTSLSKIFEESGSEVPGDVFEKIMRTLAVIRERDDLFCREEIDQVFSTAIRHIGLVDVLTHVPLDIDPDLPVLPLNFRRAWLLPLAQNMKNAPLSLFIKYFLPLAIKLHRRLATLEPLRRKLYSSIERKIWELLPRFLRSPSDFEESLPTLAPVIGSALMERPDLRITLLASIRSAISFAEEEPDLSVERKQMLGQYSKNYLPILFNIYSADDQSNKNGYDDKAVKLSTLETIRRYVHVTPSGLLQDYADSAINKLTDDQLDAAKKGRISDIICVLIPGLNAMLFKKILQTINPWFVDTKWQKKAYRILSEMYKRINDESLREFFSSHQEFLIGMLQYDIKKVVSSARIFRIGIYRSVLPSMSDYGALSSFCMTIVNDIILSLDSALGMRTRSQATKCLQEMCICLIQVGSPVDVGPSDALESILNKILEFTTAPETSSEKIPLSLIKPGLIALNIFAQKQVKLLNGCLLSKLVDGCCTAITDPRPEVRALVLRLLRILCQKLPEYALQQYKELIINTTFSQSTENNTLKVRKANRILAEILVEKFSKENLERFVTDANWLKVIKNADKKLNKRRKRTTSLDENQMEDEETVSRVTTATSRISKTKTDALFDILDSDDEDEGLLKKSKGAKSILLKEGDEDDLVEMLDRNSVIHNIAMSVVSSKINKKDMPKKKDQDIFKFTKDGRLIISDVDDVKAKKKLKKSILDDSDEEEEQAKLNVKNKAKSRIDDDGSDFETKTLSKYMPGGKGIHRELSQKTSDHRKKDERFEPYAYIPLRKKANQKGALRSILKKQKRNIPAGQKRSNAKMSKK
uniref:Ribosomal RNA-processing protein 12-like conserved domain-containing protein n=1 Tax=Acrobeloides nanus TaxID=290746 RepID=A0A914E8V8_9BILA